MKTENTDFLRGYYFGLKEALNLEKHEIARILKNHERGKGREVAGERRKGRKETPSELAHSLVQAGERRRGRREMRRKARLNYKAGEMRRGRKQIAYTPYFPLSIGIGWGFNSNKEENHVIQLQTALKRLGYYDIRIDGKFGRGTKRAVQAFQFDAEIEPTGVVDSVTAERLERLLNDENRWVIPMRDEVSTPSDHKALFVEIMAAKGIPLAFATAVAEQEGNLDHFDSDGFVKLRIEFWGQYKNADHPDYQIRYRSYGMLQILDMGHPEGCEERSNHTRGDEVCGITNKEIKYSVAKNIEAGACLLLSLLRGEICQYTQGDDLWHDCKECIQSVPTVKRDFQNTKWHRWKCNAVPDYQQIPCSWPEAIRRYNGSGKEAEAYRDEILTRIVGAKRFSAV